MRRLVPIAVFLLAAVAAALPETAGDRILGEWRGTSLCVNLELAPACKDETVRYVFTKKSGAEGGYHQVADKLVDGTYQFMGEFDLVYSAADETWSAEFTSRRCPVKCTWWYRLGETGLVGGLTDGSGEAVRKVEARRYAS